MPQTRSTAALRRSYCAFPALLLLFTFQLCFFPLYAVATGSSYVTAASQTCQGSVTASCKGTTQLSNSSATQCPPNPFCGGGDTTSSPVLCTGLRFAQAQANAIFASLKAFNRYPTFTRSPWGPYNLATANDWLSGFFPGILMALAQHYGNDTTWQTRAATMMTGLESQALRITTHDLGFTMIPFSKAQLALGGSASRQVLLTAAKSLATRFNPTFGAISTGGGNSTVGGTTVIGDGRVIVDSLMNQELLMVAAGLQGGNLTWREVAINHSLTVARDHVLDDCSVIQAVFYNLDTGDVLRKVTFQGKPPAGVWSRGQAWAIYGFGMMYRWTGRGVFLDAARCVADYWIDNAPADRVPWYDFTVGGNASEARDTSAAAITALGMLQLAMVDPGLLGARTCNKYYDFGVSTLNALSQAPYLGSPGTGQSILLQGAYHAGNNLSNQGFIVGDYYYVEALLLYRYLQCPAAACGMRNGAAVEKFVKAYRPY